MGLSGFKDLFGGSNGDGSDSGEEATEARLTRIEVSMDVKPDSLLEKAGRSMRFTKRAVRGDFHRFKAFVEMEEDEAA